MKKVLLTLSATLVLGLSSAAFAGGNDIEIGIEDSLILQEQHGHGLFQDAAIGLVSKDFYGDATIYITGSKIKQSQKKSHNMQAARIGVVGCDCSGLDTGGKGKGKH